MAERRPTRLDEYCQQTGTSFFDLKLRCIFCNFTVDLAELAEFYCKKLSLIWKEGTCYACCKRCIYLSAKYELENCALQSVLVAQLSETVHTPLRDIVLRCKYCYRKLDHIEKIDCKARGEYATLVRGHWRSVCRNCFAK